jgi:dolichol-phosphate mannosyltransferase
MSDGLLYSIVLPAYLEEENLRLLLPRLRTVLDARAEPYEIVVVDTVTPLDATPKLCAEAGVRCVTRAPGNTFGDAVRTGIAQARGRWIVFMDADGSHAPEFLPRLLEHTPTYDVVIASRYIDGGYTENRRALVLMSRILNVSYSLVLGIPCRDVSNSFKVYEAERIKHLALRCHNFDIVEELLFKLIRRYPSTRIKEVPFTFKKRMFGDTKRNLVAFAATYLYTILRLRFGPR